MNYDDGHGQWVIFHDQITDVYEQFYYPYMIGHVKPEDENRIPDRYGEPEWPTFFGLVSKKRDKKKTKPLPPFKKFVLNKTDKWRNYKMDDLDEYRQNFKRRKDRFSLDTTR